MFGAARDWQAPSIMRVTTGEAARVRYRVINHWCKYHSSPDLQGLIYTEADVRVYTS